MYQKILVPLDNSDDSRSVVKALSGLVGEGGEAILLHVISPERTRETGGFKVLGTQIEEEARDRAMVHLNRLSSEFTSSFSSTNKKYSNHLSHGKCLVLKFVSL
ncbi:MAG TPA: hypothetical protein EYO88_14185, partial [Alphaproteobacteria bacterium]|nr:hypothetical protein [Alphaproteobacteria bacterium]